MTPERHDTPLPEDLRDELNAARPEQIRRLIGDILSVRLPEPTHVPAPGGRLN